MWCLLCLDAEQPGKYVGYLEHRLAKCQAHARGKNQVICFEPRERIADVAVAIGHLPTEPVLQLGGNRGVELEAVIASVRDVWVDAELFGDGGPAVELGVKRFPENDFASLACNGRLGRLSSGSRNGSVERLVIAAAAKDVEGRLLVVDHVIAHAAAQDIAQIEVLKLVVFEVCEAENEEVFADIQVAANSAANSVGGGGVDAVD